MTMRLTMAVLIATLVGASSGYASTLVEIDASEHSTTAPPKPSTVDQAGVRDTNTPSHPPSAPASSRDDSDSPVGEHAPQHPKPEPRAQRTPDTL